VLQVYWGAANSIVEKLLPNMPISSIRPLWHNDSPFTTSAWIIGGRDITAAHAVMFDAKIPSHLEGVVSPALLTRSAFRVLMEMPEFLAKLLKGELEAPQMPRLTLALNGVYL